MLRGLQQRWLLREKNLTARTNLLYNFSDAVLILPGKTLIEIQALCSEAVNVGLPSLVSTQEVPRSQKSTCPKL